MKLLQELNSGRQCTADVPAANRTIAADCSADAVEEMTRSLRTFDLESCSRLLGDPLQITLPAFQAALRYQLAYNPPILRRRTWNKSNWSNLRVRAASLLAQFPIEANLCALTHALLYDVTEVRAAAALALEQVGPAAAPAVVAQLNARKRLGINPTLDSIQLLGKLGNPSVCNFLVSVVEKRSARRIKSVVLPCIVSSLLVGALGMLLAYWSVSGNLGRDHVGRAYMLDALASGWLMCSVICGVPISVASCWVQLRRRIAVNLAAVTALASIYEISSDQTRSHSASMSRQNVSRMQEDRLLSLLAKGEPQLRLAVIQALEHVGTGRSADPVARFVHRKINSARVLDAAIASEAARVLPILEARRASEEVSHTLVRAGNDTSSPAQLLRSSSDIRPAQSCPDGLVLPIRSSQQTEVLLENAK